MTAVPLTIEQLCSQRDLGLRLVAGEQAKTNVIGWAHTSELPDPTRWLEGGELLMTLGLQLPDDPVEQRLYVERLAAVGLAGLAFDAGVIHHAVPEAIVRAGDEFGLPIVAIPGPTPFLAISRAVITSITADQVAEVAQLSRNQERLAGAALVSGSSGVLSSLQRSLSATAITLDASGELVEAAGPKSKALAERVGKHLSEGGRRGASRQRSFSHVDDEGYLIVQKLGKVKGAGVLAVGRRRQLQPNERLLVAHAATLLALLLDRPAHLREAEMRLRRMLFRSLLRPGGEADLGLLRYVGFTPEQRVAVVAFVDTGAPRAAEALVDSALSATGVPVLIMSNSKGLAVLAPAQSIAEVAEVARAALERERAQPLSGGVGGSVDVSAVLDSFRQANAAARYAASHPGEVVDFSDLGIFDLLLGTQSRDTLAAIAGSVLSPLDAAVHGHPGDLLRTTYEFVSHGGQWEATSAALGVHRHTLRSRIDRISALLGRDLTSASERAEVWLALKARELLSLTSAGAADKAKGPSLPTGKASAKPARSKKR